MLTYPVARNIKANNLVTNIMYDHSLKHIALFCVFCVYSDITIIEIELWCPMFLSCFCFTRGHASSVISTCMQCIQDISQVLGSVIGMCFLFYLCICWVFVLPV
jgi:hypothetical protein